MRIFLALGSLLGLAFLLAPQSAQAEVVAERIWFFQPDGRTYIAYNSTRSDFSNYTVNLWKTETLEKYLYIYPNDYRWDTSGAELNKLRFPQGSYALMNRETLDENLAVDEKGIFTYKTSSKKYPNGHYGFWNDPQDYDQFVFAWVLPPNLEVIDYECNRKGEWVQRHNTLAFFGQDVNDMLFTIRYRPRARAAYEALRAKLEGREDVELEQQAEGVQVTLAQTLLFASGSSELSESGQAVLGDVASAIKQLGSAKVVVAGHTDNVPIQGRLAQKYSSNWELSGARAFNVLHFLASKGVPESRFEVRAFGAQQPRASNDTAKGRARNRRIELRVIPGA